MPRTLVTGGAGFLGSHLCEYLLDKGHEVICMDNLITGSEQNISGLKSSNFRFVNHNVSEFIKLDGDFFFVLMFGALTYYFYLKGTGKLKDEDDPFVK